MLRPVYYVQECPTCGRSLQIRVAHLGKHVVCQHCLAEFEARDPANQPVSASDSSQNLLALAEELLATVDRQHEDNSEWASADGL